MNLSAITEVRKAGVFLDAGIKTIDISFCATIYEGEKHDPILDSEDWEAQIEALDKQLKEQGIRVNTTHLPYRYHYEEPGDLKLVVMDFDTWCSYHLDKVTVE